MLIKDICWGCWCSVSRCDRDFFFDLYVVTLIFKVLSGLYLGNCIV